MQKTIHNVETAEITTVEMTKNEMDEINAQAQILKQETLNINKSSKDLQAAKQAVLAKLGLTADEVAALLG